MPLSEQERNEIVEIAQTSRDITSFKMAMLTVLLSIDERLEVTNDFYLQNQEERTRPNG